MDVEQLARGHDILHRTGNGLIRGYSAFHFGISRLLLFGFASLKWSRARPVYLIGLCVCLAALPVQARLVQRQILSCDAP